MASMVRIWSFFFVLFVFGLLFAFETKEAQSKEFVLTLDNSNFHKTVGKHDFIVVEFYAPWCVYSKQLAPEYEKAAAVLSRRHPLIILAKVDCNENKNKGLASEFKIRGFPTIMILRNGAYGRKIIQEYKGPRDAYSIVAFLTNQSGPAFREICSGSAVPTLVSQLPVPSIRAVHPSNQRLGFSNEYGWFRFVWGEMKSKPLIARMDGSDAWDREYGI